MVTRIQQQHLYGRGFNGRQKLSQARTFELNPTSRKRMTRCTRWANSPHMPGKLGGTASGVQPVEQLVRLERIEQGLSDHGRCAASQADSSGMPKMATHPPA